MVKKGRCDEIHIRGKQRKVVYASLSQPKTGREILTIAQETAPSMTYQDLRHILRDFEQQGLIRCLNPREQTGRFYLRTDIELDKKLTAEDVLLAAMISRASMRLALLRELGSERLDGIQDTTVTGLRKRMRDSYSISLNHALSGMQFLHQHDLAEIVDFTRKRDLKIYRITNKGRRILKLVEPNQPTLLE